MPDTVAKLYHAHDTVVAIKEASGGLAQIHGILSRCDITVLSGDDALTLPMLAVGAKGVVSVAANIVPKKIKAMLSAFDDKDIVLARRLHYDLLPLFDTMFIETNPIPVKTALSMMGKIEKEFRLPLCALMPENEEKIAALVAKYQLA